MPWWLILILIILILLVLAALHPIRLQAEGRAADTVDLMIVLKPFGIFPGKFKIVNIVDKPFDSFNKGKKTERKKRRRFLKKRNKAGAADEKQNFAEKLPIAKDDIWPLIDQCLSGLQVEKLDMEANLSGDPYHSGIACGALWTFFGGGFAYLSHRVKKFTEKPIMNFGVDLERPWSAYFKFQVMIRVGDLGRLGWKFVVAVIRRRRQNRLDSKGRKKASAV